MAADDFEFTTPSSSTTLFVLANDTGAGLTVVAVGSVTGGNAYISSGGTGVIYYAPASPGQYSFTYTIQDNQARTASATVYVNIEEQDPGCVPNSGVLCEAPQW